MVIAEDHVVGVIRVDPKSMIIASEAEWAALPRLSTVTRAPGSSREYMDDARVIGIYDDLSVVISRSTTDRLSVGTHFFPCDSGVVRSVNFTPDHSAAGLVIEKFLLALLFGHVVFVGVLDCYVDDTRVAFVNVDTYPS
jgi:hypothetical protein